MASMNEIDGELELLAFQYVSGELAVEDIERFELRLADDQSAREAVARVVQIGQAVALSAGDDAIVAGKADYFDTGSDSRNVSRWVIAAASIAAAFLAGVGISQWLERGEVEPGSNMVVRDRVVPGGDAAADDRHDVTDAQSGTNAATDVVALWSASAAEFTLGGDERSATVSVNGDEEIPELPLDGADFWLAGDESVSDDDEFRVPSWMLAAVSPDDDPEMESPDMMSEEN